MNNELFFSFAPNEDIEGNDEAYKALSFSLDSKNKRVHNIAISGPFGAGKSSLWRSYKKQILSKKTDEYDLPKEEEILDISLAKFEEERKSKSKSDNQKNVVVNISNSNLNNIKEEKSENPKIINANNISDNQDDEKIEFEIEKAILQQMLFSVKKKDIPCLDSYKISEGNTIGKFLFSLSLSIIFFWWMNYYFEEKVFDSFLIYDVVGLKPIIYSFFIFFIVVISIILGICLYRFFLKIGNMHICNFSFEGLNVSFEQSNGSLINQNYSAIVYFFEKTKKKVVVFEDLDRFSSNKIFVKLRELNTILNSDSDKLIKFIYMVKENLFTKYERTKFFEMIIPVLPVVNMEACADFLLNEKANQKEKKKKNEQKRNINGNFQRESVDTDDYVLLNVEDKLLRIVGGFINDLRIVYDCLNEFRIFKKQLKKDLKNIDGIENKIFAMVIYKNYYPQDFEDFHRHRGFLYEICKRLKHENIEEIKDWVYTQCLKLELKFRYGDEDEENIKLLEKNKNLPSLLFDLLENEYIDMNCEFYVSRKYLGDLTLEDCRYFLNAQSRGVPDYNLKIQKLRLLEGKILDNQWHYVSALNNRMFAYELSLFNKSLSNEKMIVKEMIYAIQEAEKQEKKFIDQFLKFLDDEIQSHKIILLDEMYSIDSRSVSPTIKEMFWEAVFQYMNKDTLAMLSQGR